MNTFSTIPVTTPDELRAAKAELGLSSAGLANALRLGGDSGKTIRRWQSGECAIPGPAQVAIELLLFLNRAAKAA